MARAMKPQLFSSLGMMYSVLVALAVAHALLSVMLVDLLDRKAPAGVWLALLVQAVAAVSYGIVQEINRSNTECAPTARKLLSLETIQIVCSAYLILVYPWTFIFERLESLPYPIEPVAAAASSFMHWCMFFVVGVLASQVADILPTVDSADDTEIIKAGENRLSKLVAKVVGLLTVAAVIISSLVWHPDRFYILAMLIAALFLTAHRRR